MARHVTPQEDGVSATQVIRVWRANGITWSTIRVYRRVVRQFYDDCGQRGALAKEQLTRECAERWAVRHARRCQSDADNVKATARSALRAWSWGLHACGVIVPSWDNAPAATAALPALQEAFMRYRSEVRGVAESTIRRDVDLVGEFLHYLRHCGHTIATIQMTDVDGFLHACSRRFALRTLARVAYTLRSFLRFLHASGRISHDMASGISSPRVRRGEVPPRALPWSDVRRIIRAIDKKTRTGRRDYALLLMMATYGLGSAEVRSLTLDSVDWHRRQLHIVRPKTGGAVDLPLLPSVAQALVKYLQHGRPRYCTSRALFVQMHAPYGTLRSPSAIRHVIHKHAAATGISGVFLGSHVLRHSHASRQIDQGVSATVVGDILGHRRPESTSAYVRVALRRLRGLALPVPR
jgi:integrase/recombinase XerD